MTKDCGGFVDRQHKGLRAREEENRRKKEGKRKNKTTSVYRLLLTSFLYIYIYNEI